MFERYVLVEAHTNRLPASHSFFHLSTLFKGFAGYFIVMVVLHTSACITHTQYSFIHADSHEIWLYLYMYEQSLYNCL